MVDPRVLRWLTLFSLLMIIAAVSSMYLLPPGVDDGAHEEAERPFRPEADVTLTGSLPAIPGTDPDRFDGFLAPIFERIDPEQDEWDTEVLSQAANEQLMKVARLLSQPEQADEVSALNLVASDFSATPLRPEPLESVFADESIVVLRPALRATGSSRARHARVGGLAAALAELSRPLRDATDRHAKLKVFRVGAVRAGEFSTTALFQSSGRTREGIVQQSANWTCRWTRFPANPPGDADGEEYRLKSISVTDYEEIVPGETGGIRFADCTEAVLGSSESFRKQLTRGVDYWRSRLEANYGVDPNGNQGIAVGDANGDGLDDIYVCKQGGLPNRLYVQNAGGTLRDVSAEAGVDWMEVCRSALFVDLDNDGDQDLVMAQGWHFMIMAGDGSGKFTVTMQRRSSAHLYSTSATDYDNDGDLDLFFCGRNPGREMRQPEGILGTPIPYHDANNGGPNMLWQNDGQGRFTEVTEAVGLDVNNRRYSYAASWEDFDNDGDMDLYVANDFGRNNLYRNDVNQSGERRFKDVAAELGVEDISAGMSVSWGDYNNDGLMDVYVANMFSSAGNRIAYQRRFRSGAADATLGHYRRHARGNTLFENRTDGAFRDVSVAAGATMGRWAWGSKFVDLNNDGLEDIYVTNGFITTEDSGDL